VEEGKCEHLYNDRVNALLRSLTIFLSIALLLFVGLHAVVPHDHPHVNGTFHGSEIPPVAHAENKIFVLVFAAAALFIIADVVSSLVLSFARSVSLIRSRQAIFAAIPVRYDEALRKGRIHSRCD
jgi:hypothetical protein